MAKTLFFFDHDHEERSQQDAKSKSNDFEAQFALHLATYLLQQETFVHGASLWTDFKYRTFCVDDIAIITPYVGQLITLKRHMTKISIPMRIDAKDEELLTDYAEDGLHCLFVSILNNLE